MYQLDEIPQIDASVGKTPILSQLPTFTNPNGYLWFQPDAHYTRYIFSEDMETLKCRLGCGFKYIPQFALFPRANNTTNAKIINLLEVIAMIRGSRLKEHCRQIKEAKQIGDQKRRTQLKEELPYITHSGIFIPRRNDGLKLPGFTYQLDIDKIDNPEKILANIVADKQLDVLIASISVSGDGVKAILFLKELMFLSDHWTHEIYREVYHRATDVLSNYFNEKYGVKIDEQMKSISQPFFLFYSPDLFINKAYHKWI